jgi:hypothetical protein
MLPADRPLVFVLRLLGLIDLAALLAVVMPEAWMAATHHALGLGELPPAPLVGYLARSASALYAVHGALLIFVSFDVPRYRPLIAFLAWTALVHGGVLVAIDAAAAMPWWWTLLEGPLYILLAAIVLLLLRRGRAASGASCGEAAEPVQFAPFPSSVKAP